MFEDKALFNQQGAASGIKFGMNYFNDRRAEYEKMIPISDDLGPTNEDAPNDPGLMKNLDVHARKRQRVISSSTSSPTFTSPQTSQKL